MHCDQIRNRSRHYLYRKSACVGILCSNLLVNGYVRRGRHSLHDLINHDIVERSLDGGGIQHPGFLSHGHSCASDLEWVSLHHDSVLCSMRQ